MGPIRPFEGACGDVPGVLGRREIVSRDIGAALRGWRHEGPCESSGPVFGGWPWQASPHGALSCEGEPDGDITLSGRIVAIRLDRVRGRDGKVPVLDLSGGATLRVDLGALHTARCAGLCPGSLVVVRLRAGFVVALWPQAEPGQSCEWQGY